MRQSDIFEFQLQNQQAHTAKAIERCLHDELELEPRKSASEYTRQLLDRASLEALTLVEQCEEDRTPVPRTAEETGVTIDKMAPVLADEMARVIMSDYGLGKAWGAKRRRLREVTAQEATRFMRAVRNLWAADRQLLSVCITRAGEEASREEIDQVGDPERWDESHVQVVADKMVRLVSPRSSIVPPHRVRVERSATDHGLMQVIVEIADGTRLESEPVPVSVHFPTGADLWTIRPPVVADRR